MAKKTIWREGQGREGPAPMFFLAGTTSLESRASKHEPWALSHESLTIDNRLINKLIMIPARGPQTAFLCQSFDVIFASWALGTQAEADDEQSWYTGSWQLG